MAVDSSGADLLRRLGSAEWQTVRDALTMLEHRLRDGCVGADEMRDVVDRLSELVGHRKWEVRKALADAVLHLRHDAFQVILARLLADSNTFVQGAAKRTLARRSEIATADTLSDEHGELLRRWLADLEARHGTRAREAALRVAQRFAGVAMREAHHELVKFISPLDLPLARLAAALEEDEVDRETLRELVQRVQTRAGLLMQVVSSLREFYTDVTPHFEHENLASLVADAYSLVVDQLGNQFGTIVTTIDVPPDLVVRAHRHRLVQALTNVLKNGVEAHDGLDRPPVLSVRALVEQDSVVILCEDQGRGLSDEAAIDAFSLFSSGKGSTGFGLPLAKKVVESEHGGTISLESRRSVGTTVRISLPLEHQGRA